MTDGLKEYWRKRKAGEIPPPQRSGNIRRKVRCESSWVRGGEVVLTVYPHGELGFRDPGHHAEYRLSMTEAFRQAVLITTARIQKRVKELRKEGHGLKSARRIARKETL